MRVAPRRSVRRSAFVEPAGRQHSSDAELWVAPELWAAALDDLTRISTDLHRAALPPRTSGAAHVSITLSMFTMRAEESTP